ncbi:MAG: hypothetical protein MMC33_002230 [Icmadophila ericetorum]|nr:hypothetical protein [Icmadophila ericetorum]
MSYHDGISSSHSISLGARKHTGQTTSPQNSEVEDQVKVEWPWLFKKSGGGEQSIMREYLKSSDDSLKFAWPEGGTHWVFNVGDKIPLHHEKSLCRQTDKTDKAFVDQYRADKDCIKFARSFAVKELRAPAKSKDTGNIIEEVEIHKSLYHPHVTAFLGTYLARGRLHIMMYPAALGDLGDYLLDVSNYWKRLKSKPEEETGPARSYSLVENSNFRNTYDRRSSGSQAQKLRQMRQWIPCVTQALCYLHTSEIRHKNIKPENILIDSSGSVLLADFGISRKFEPGHSHVTNDQWQKTEKYASPEMMKGKTVEHGDPSDVFSLGCVFVEIATVCQEEDLDHFSKYRSELLNDTYEESAYYRTLSKVHRWIEILQDKHIDTKVVEVLPAIRKMLDEDPGLRPESSKLWSYFKDVSDEKCSDCNEHHPRCWKPTDTKRQQTQRVSHRLSVHLNQIAEESGRRSIPEGIEPADELTVPTSPKLSAYRPKSPTSKGSRSPSRYSISQRDRNTNKAKSALWHESVENSTQESEKWFPAITVRRATSSRLPQGYMPAIDQKISPQSASPPKPKHGLLMYSKEPAEETNENDPSSNRLLKVASNTSSPENKTVRFEGLPLSHLLHVRDLPDEKLVLIYSEEKRTLDFMSAHILKDFAKRHLVKPCELRGQGDVMDGNKLIVVLDRNKITDRLTWGQRISMFLGRGLPPNIWVVFKDTEEVAGRS